MAATNEQKTEVRVEIRYRIPGKSGRGREVFQGTSADRRARAFAAKLVKREGNDGEIRWFRWEVQA